MYYGVEFDIYNFEFWSGAKDRIEEIRELGMLGELEDLTFSSKNSPIFYKWGMNALSSFLLLHRGTSPSRRITKPAHK